MNARALDLAWRIAAAAGLVLLAWLSLTPDPVTLAELPQVDKLQHFAAYAALTLWLAQLDERGSALRERAFALVLLGIAFELAQLSIDHREFSLADIAANVLGVAAGAWLAPPRTPNLLARLARALDRSGAARVR